MEGGALPTYRAGDRGVASGRAGQGRAGRGGARQRRERGLALEQTSFKSKALATA